MPASDFVVLFDLDGVLVDSRTPIARSINFALDRHGLETLPEAELYPMIGPPLHDAFASLLAGIGASPDLADSCVAAYRERYSDACVRETPPMPGMDALLKALLPIRVMAVATSKPAEYARPILESLGMAAHFRSIVGPSLSARNEPKHETVRRALSELGARRGVMVGDRHHDVSAGRANGLVTVGVAWGIGSVAELREAGVDHEVETPEALLALLLELDA